LQYIPLNHTGIFVESAIEKEVSAARRDTGRVVYHVSPEASANRWVVSQENGLFRREFDTKEEAEDFAKRRAQLEKFSQVKVHKKDGTMDYESTYGDDPRDIPG
jgi:hypothetical protein